MSGAGNGTLAEREIRGIVECESPHGSAPVSRITSRSVNGPVCGVDRVPSPRDLSPPAPKREPERRDTEHATAAVERRRVVVRRGRKRVAQYRRFPGTSSAALDSDPGTRRAVFSRDTAPESGKVAAGRRDRMVPRSRFSRSPASAIVIRADWIPNPGKFGRLRPTADTNTAAAAS